MSRKRKRRNKLLQDMHGVVLGDREWDILFVPPSRIAGRRDKPRWGHCDFENNEIRINYYLDGRDLYDTILHEMQHACHPTVSEYWIEHTSTEMMGVLWGLFNGTKASD